MPEVFTEENKKYYTQDRIRNNISLSIEEIVFYRNYYINHTATEVSEKI